MKSWMVPVFGNILILVVFMVIFWQLNSLERLIEDVEQAAVFDSSGARECRFLARGIDINGTDFLDPNGWGEKITQSGALNSGGSYICWGKRLTP